MHRSPIEAGDASQPAMKRSLVLAVEAGANQDGKLCIEADWPSSCMRSTSSANDPRFLLACIP